MNLSDAEAIINSLMLEYAQNLNGWKWEWSQRMYHSFGKTIYKDKILRFSKTATQHGTAEDFRDTVLHEIAHVLAGPRAGHGRLWKRAAYAIGAKPVRTAKSVYTEEVKKQLYRKPKYSATCGVCQTLHTLKKKPRESATYLCICHKKTGNEKDAILNFQPIIKEHNDRHSNNTNRESSNIRTT